MKRSFFNYETKKGEPALAKRPFTRPLAVLALILLGIYLLIAIFAPLIAPPAGTDPYRIPRDGYQSEPQPMGAFWNNQPPDLPFWYQPFTGKQSWTHLLGTTEGQYDIFYGVVWGTRTAFFSSLAVVFMTFVIGVFVGAIAGYFGGMVDEVLMRITDIFMTLPFLFAAMILAAVLTPLLGRSLLPSMLALTTFGWMGYARMIRGEVLSIKERSYILSARAMGAGHAHILFKQILPNAIFPTLVFATLNIGEVTLSFAALSFLGIGTQPGFADWGQLLGFGRNWIMSLSQYWHIIVWPAMVLVFYVLAWNLLGDALRDHMDPRTGSG